MACNSNILAKSVPKVSSQLPGCDLWPQGTCCRTVYGRHTCDCRAGDCRRHVRWADKPLPRWVHALDLVESEATKGEAHRGGSSDRTHPHQGGALGAMIQARLDGKVSFPWSVRIQFTPIVDLDDANGFRVSRRGVSDWHASALGVQPPASFSVTEGSLEELGSLFLAVTTLDARLPK